MTHAGQYSSGPWRFAAAALLALVFGAAGGLAQDSEGDEDDRGLTEYEIACMACHGVNGRGDGPEAASLATPPADLTQIAKANGGIFPVKRVTEMIDGRAAVKSHGARDMPVWGQRYRVSEDPADSAREVDKRARELIAVLVDYLKSIQQK